MTHRGGAKPEEVPAGSTRNEVPKDPAGWGPGGTDFAQVVALQQRTNALLEQLLRSVSGRVGDRRTPSLAEMAATEVARRLA